MTSIAISGASGKLGRMIVQSVRALTKQPLVLLSRTPDALIGISNHVETRFADFDDGERCVDSMTEVDRLIVISTNTFSPHGRRERQHRAAIDAAIQAGVRHIVYTSFLKADSIPLRAMTSDHAATEAMLEKSGLGYTVLRNAFYDDLALQFLRRADGDGRIVHATGSGGVAYVTRQQCADAAAVAVLDRFSGTRLLDITGPKATTISELAKLASVRTGRPYTDIQVSQEELVEHLVAASVPPESAAMLAWIDDGIAKGAGEPASADFERLAGREAPALALLI